MSTASKSKSHQSKSSREDRKGSSALIHTSSDEMSADDMRNVLYDRLHNRGLLDTLKSQLRNYMVAELSGKTKAKPDVKGDRSLERRLLDSLIYKYLCDSGCDYTVGVFLPEAGITRREILSAEEMKQLLTLPPGDVGDNSLLQAAVSHLMSAQSTERLTHESTQTDGHTVPLTDKLAHIDTEFMSKHRPQDNSISVEERLLSHQRQVELACSQKAQHDLERWKKVEMEILQITEREKVHREMQERRKQLEEEYRRKAAAILEREKSLTDSVKVEYEAVQRETFMQRQQLLQQTDQLRQRETEIREEKNHMARLQRANEEKIEKLEQMLRKREAEMDKRELQMDNTLRNQQERCKLEEKLSYDSKYRELKAWEEKLKDKESALEREKRSLLTSNERKELLELRLCKQEMEKQVSKSSLEVSGLEMQISSLQERLAKMFDYELVKESNISLKKDLEMTKDRLDSLMKEHHFLQEKYEQLMIDGREKAGVGEIMLIKTQIQKERDKVLDEKVLLEHRLKEMDARFNEQVRKNQMLMREFELQTERQKYMNKEYGELRKELGESRVESTLRSKRQASPAKDPSFYDTTFRQSLAPEVALDPDWSADISSAAEVSTATEESIVTETRRRLDHLNQEAENLHSAFKSVVRQGPPPSSKHSLSPVKGNLRQSQVTFHSSADFQPPSRLASQRVAASDVLRSDQYSLLPTHTDPLTAAAASLSHAAPLSQADQFNRPTPNKHPSEIRSPPSPPAKSATASAHAWPATESSPGAKETATERNTLNNQWKATRVDEAPPTSLDSQWKAPKVGASPTSLDSQWKAPKVDGAPPTSLDSQWKAPKVDGAPPTSLDSQWKAPKVDGVPPTLLDSQWKAPKVDEAPPTSLDSQWKAPKVDGDPPTSLDSQWKRTEEQTPPTALDSQWKVSSALDDQQKSASGPELESASSQQKLSPPASSEPAAGKQVERPSDDLAGIDPLMQKYMKMVQQQKSQPEQSKMENKTADEDEHESTSEHISLAKSDHGGGATDDDFW